MFESEARDVHYNLEAGYLRGGAEIGVQQGTGEGAHHVRQAVVVRIPGRCEEVEPHT